MISNIFYIYSKIVARYGKPSYCVNQKHGVCKWIKGETEKDISPHELITLKDEYVEHTKPKPHRDFVYSVVKVYIPPEFLVDDLKQVAMKDAQILVDYI